MPCVISIEHLSKHYQLGVISGYTLTSDLQRWWALMRDQPDPLLKIGQEKPNGHLAGAIWALKDVSFTVEQGEVLGIIGRNGAGKSTLLKILSRVTAPTQGAARIKGRIASLLEVGTGFQPELTGRENIFLNGAILGMSKAEVRRKFDEIVAFAELGKFIDTPVKRYSSGMYVRLAFAVAAHLEPEIMLIDEVLAVGDAEFQKKCLGKMGEVSHQGRTVLFVSHNMDAVRSLCSRSILLNNGKLESDGDSEIIVRQYLGMVQTQASSQLNLTSRVIDLHSIRLHNDQGQDCDTFRWDESIGIEMDYHVHELVNGLQIGLTISTEDGRPVLSTGSRSTPHQRKLLPGNGNSHVSIPKCLLSPGRYSIFINAHTFADVFCVNENAISFQVLDVGREKVGREGNMKWPGVISPYLPWQNLSQGPGQPDEHHINTQIDD